MALPPIISNFPLVKLFRTEQTDKTGSTKENGTTTPAETSSLPQDVVEISNAAQTRLDGTKNLSEEDVEEVLAPTREFLERSGYSLGLDPSFV